MNSDRVRHYKRAITDAQARGVADSDIAEVVSALRSGTNPGELYDALTQYEKGAASDNAAPHTTA